MAHLPSLFDRAFNRNPARDFPSIQRQFDRFFDRFASRNPFDFDSEWMTPSSFTPSCDVDETDSAYLLTFDVPGVKKDDIRIDFRNGVLTVSGERKEENEENRKGRHRSERFYGNFVRSFTLPADVEEDQIEADYDDGVLRVAVPKSSEKSETRKIKIGEGKSGSFRKNLGRRDESVPTH